MVLNMAIKLGTYSRFKQTEIVIFDGEQVFGRWKSPSMLRRSLSASEMTTFYVSHQFAGRPDLIANVVYGDSELDWVIIALNRPADVLNWPRPGDVIKVPATPLVMAEVL